MRLARHVTPGAGFSLGAVAWLLLGWVSLVFAATSYPDLSGRIVDGANIIPAAIQSAIEPKLADLETRSGIQLVVATVPTLGGQEIEPYANELFRTWKLGEKLKNNGVLLIVAPNEHKVRIEVGYGLEGTLTDALSKIVISNAIAPRFKAGDFGGGVQRGVDDIITILTTDSAEWQARPKVREEQSLFDQLLPFLLIALVIFIIWRSWRGPARRGPWGKTTSGSSTWFPSGGSSWSSGSGGSSWGDSGGGFSGGGGSSGGGGASGGW